MSAHQIKVQRAQHGAAMLPKAEAEIMASIPDELLERLTARELTLVMQALNTHWHKAREFERNEIRGEGGVWDDSTQSFRELAAVALGRLGGLASKGKTSPAKAKASAANGKKGGRPKKSK